MKYYFCLKNNSIILLIKFKEFRETIKKQVQQELHIDCEAELFAAYIIAGLELFKLNFI